MMRLMNIISIPFDVSFHFDERLREIPNAPDEMQRAVDFLLAQVNEAKINLHQQLYFYGLIGVYARILGDFPLTHNALTTAMPKAVRFATIALSEELEDELLKAVNQLRLAHLYQWQQQYTLSDRLFRELLVRCVSNPNLEPYLDFVFQHAGKSKFDQGRYATAQKYFQWALAIRLIKGDPSLIESTQFALKITRRQGAIHFDEGLPVHQAL
jgi:tetratricopeptide (TPR) repeat protein